MTKQQFDKINNKPLFSQRQEKTKLLPIGTVLLFKEITYPLEFDVITFVYSDRYLINNSDHYILFSDIKKYFIYKPKGDK